MVGVLLGLMGLFVRFVMVSTGVFYCLVCCVVRCFCRRSMGIERLFVVDGIVVVFVCCVLYCSCKVQGKERINGSYCEWRQ